jgi:hypothetical protein
MGLGSALNSERPVLSGERLERRRNADSVVEV